MTCTFFGHKDTPGCVRECLMPVLRKLITEQGVNAFLVGNQGVFDHMVVSALQELENEFQDIRYQIVLAYMQYEEVWFWSARCRRNRMRVD